MKRFFKEFLILTIGFVFTFCNVPSISAQETDEFTLEEITVTAQKREENVQKAPVSTTVLTGDTLSERGKSQMQDIIGDIPGVEFLQDSGGPEFVVRGVRENLAQADKPTSVYVDNVYMANPFESLAGQYDVSRVEANRGPQGTLYGVNAVAGSVNLVTNNPDLNKSEASGVLEYGDYSKFHVEGVVNMPLSETLALRTSLYAESHDGYYSNGQFDSDTKSGRIKLLYQPNGVFKLVLSGTYTQIGGTGAGGGAKGYDPTRGSIEDLEDPWATTEPADNKITRSKSYRNYLDMTWNLSFASLVSQTGYVLFKDHSLSGLTDGDGISLTTGRKPMYSQEVRLASLADSETTWTAGLSYFYRDMPMLMQSPTMTIDAPFDKTKSKAVFGQMSYPVLDGVRVTGGLRYTNDNKENSTAFNGVVESMAAEYNSTTYKLGIDADAGAASLLYAQVSTGYRAGGVYNLFGTLQPYEPQKLLAYQMGSKNRFLDDRLQINTEIFYYDFAGYQLTSTVYDPTLDEYVQTIASYDGVSNYGGEVETDYLIAKNDRITWSLAYLKSSLGDELTGDYEEYKNYPMDHSPEWTIDLAYEHTFNFKSGNALMARGDIHYQTKSYTDFKQTLGSEQPAYHLSNFSLRYFSKEGDWDVQAYVRNIENYPVLNMYATGRPGEDATIRIGAPRTFGFLISLRY